MSSADKALTWIVALAVTAITLMFAIAYISAAIVDREAIQQGYTQEHVPGQLTYRWVKK